MQTGDPGFSLSPPDAAWPSALLFESTVQIYERVYRALKPRSPAPRFTIRFEKFANADSFIRLESGGVTVRMSDLFEGAPAPVLESLAFILLGKLFRKAVPPAHAHRYKLFLNRRDVRKKAQLLRQMRGRKLHHGSKGTCFDLDEVFEEMNAKYFDGLMARPILGWSLQASRYRLGHFDPSHNAIIISRIFDQKAAPLLALQYVMFHEMLHLEFPVDHSRVRRCVHTPAFKQAEKRFENLAEARRLLKSLP